MKIVDIIRKVDNNGLLKYKQFTVDLIESFEEEVHKVECGELSEESVAGSIMYDIDGVLECMRTDIPDYAFLENLYNEIKEVYK